jgi:hypothetical protein
MKAEVYLHQYIDRDNHIHSFVLDVTMSASMNCPTYAEFISGLFVGNYWTQPELYRLMDNGYTWESIGIGGLAVRLANNNP